jgi:hypothetical protein
VIFVVPVGFVLIYSVSDRLKVDILTALPQLSDATLMTWEYPHSYVDSNTTLVPPAPEEGVADDGARYRLRLIISGSLAGITFSVDGYSFQPVKAEGTTLSPARAARVRSASPDGRLTHRLVSGLDACRVTCDADQMCIGFSLASTQSLRRHLNSTG